ncbi:hypothetical protein L6452_38864 [Arctium lappa]|uniref:Uncharacterized protein n=1 Tax=Arctium lappa TaxID=4217 RepID=A0ACB8XQ88_ARCLA|nr:hypothetical protein L6452_38864 [Arctium lappa]
MCRAYLSYFSFNLILQILSCLVSNICMTKLINIIKVMRGRSYGEVKKTKSSNVYLLIKIRSRFNFFNFTCLFAVQDPITTDSSSSFKRAKATEGVTHPRTTPTQARLTSELPEPDVLVAPKRVVVRKAKILLITPRITPVHGRYGICLRCYKHPPLGFIVLDEVCPISRTTQEWL